MESTAPEKEQTASLTSRDQTISLLASARSEVADQQNAKGIGSQQESNCLATNTSSSQSSNSDGGIRLNMVFKATYSRQEINAMIGNGRISINGSPVERYGVKVRPFMDRVELDGVLVDMAIGIQLNKVFKATHSCREADAMIESGRVSINGNPAEQKRGVKVRPFVDRVELDGVLVEGWEAMNGISVIALAGPDAADQHANGIEVQ